MGRRASKIYFSYTKMHSFFATKLVVMSVPVKTPIFEKCCFNMFSFFVTKQLVFVFLFGLPNFVSSDSVKILTDIGKKLTD